jgi:hypothetical protein
MATTQQRVIGELELLTVRSLALADRVAAGELQFIEAVDLLYSAADWAGLPDAIEKSGLIDIGKISGDDIVQVAIAAAFANARRP